jgi:arginyl-tRNA synthetase
VLAALEEIAPALAAKTEHMSHGLLTLTTGKMSSRKGNIITARELIADLIEKASERNDDPLIAEQVAIGALKYMILRSAPGSNIIFDPEKSLSLDGDSGPYLQYALVRARSIIMKAADEGKGGSLEGGPEKPHALTRLITRFPSVVLKAQTLRAPHVIAQYLTQLAGEWNSFYAQERILGGEHEAYNLGVVVTFANTMLAGLWMLAIPAPEKM